MNPNLPIPAWGSTPNYQANLQNDVSKLAPLATSYHGAQTGVQIAPAKPFNPSSTQSDLQKFGSFLGNIASETGHVAATAATWLAKNTVDMVVNGVTEGAKGLGGQIVDNMRINDVNTQNKQNSDLLQNTLNAYKAGRLSKADYLKSLRDISQTADNLVSQSQANNNTANLDHQLVAQGTIATASLIAAVLTGGFGKVADVALTSEGAIPMAETRAASWLASKAATPYLSMIEKLPNQPALLNGLTDAAKLALEKSTAEIVSQGSAMSAGQIARASAVNFALKYPLNYYFLNQTGVQLYQELDNQKYGNAVRTLAFNAALLLSGGAIGQALKYGGKLLQGVSDRTFGQTSFWEELSKYYDKGQLSGFKDAITQKASTMSADERATLLKNLSAVEATNLGATYGDVVAAAKRLATGLSAADGVDLKSLTHADAVENMVNWADIQRAFDTEATDKGLGKVAVGRVDVRQLSGIAAALSTAPDIATRQALFDQLVQLNPNQAWANNSNFIAQIKNMIGKYEDMSALETNIKNIKAQTAVKGFSEKLNNLAASKGYIPIKPAVNEAPFTEGAGKIKVGEVPTRTVYGVKDYTSGTPGAKALPIVNDATAMSEPMNDIFVKAVQPLPILRSVGAFLVNAGLSPLNATARVYQEYNDHLAANLGGLSVFRTLANRIKGSAEGEMSNQQITDTIIKKLSDFAHDPARGGIKIGEAHIRPPMIDLRQMTTKDIMFALDISKSDAKDIGGALMDSMLQVPLSLRGLGGKIEDLNYKINPLAPIYSRIQGAARFAWNPFFQAKLAYKTEALTQLESGGKFPTIAGTNKILAMIFPEHYAALDDTRGILRKAGIFDKKASSFALGGEAVNDITQQSANLSHKLLPAQERSIAGLIMTQAEKAGMNIKDFVANFPQQVRDSVQAIAQYDRNAQFLNSPMMRTLNFAFFPFRFETKVAGFMARALAKTSPVTQFAVIKGLYNGSNFLKSPEGQAWYAQNSDVIKLLTYFTPVTTLSFFSKFLGGKPDAVGAFGELGGLPLGWIPQLLDAEGLTHITQTAYLDAKTGQELSNYIPASSRGALLMAVQDLIGQLYTYPGVTAGLPSKSSIDQNIAMEITGGNKATDLKKAPLLPLSPEQQQYQQNVEKANGTQPAMPNMPATTPQVVKGINLPAQKSTLENPIPRKLGGTAKTTRLKKSDYRPTLLPGQSQLGQL